MSSLQTCHVKRSVKIIERISERRHLSTYELIFLQIVDKHLTCFLKAHEFGHLVKNEHSHKNEESCRESGSNVSGLGQSLWQVLIKVD